MTDKFVEKTEGDAILAAHNQIRIILNRGNNIPQMTTAEIETARAAEIAASRNYNAFIFNTDSGQMEYWDNTNTGDPMPF